jgi:hypothetical protein
VRRRTEETIVTVGLQRPSGTRARRAQGVRVIGLIVVALALAAPAVVTAKQFTTWGTAVKEEAAINSPQADGCPIESPDGLSLYIASTRPRADGTSDANDIWVAQRAAKDAEWTAPEHLPAPVNSAAADFCPTPLNGGYLLFVSSRGPVCGAGDMYITRLHPVRGWEQPTNLGCNPFGPNTSGAEFSPSLVETDHGVELYFSSGVPNVAGTQDIYVSRQRADGTFGPGEPVTELNLAAHDDQMPNVSRDGLEIVFASNRPGGAGTFDVYTAHRASTDDPWSTPVNLGPAVNTERPETRPSLSGDGERLHFGRPDVMGGPSDIWVSTRSKVTGRD